MAFLTDSMQSWPPFLICKKGQSLDCPDETNGSKPDGKLHLKTTNLTVNYILPNGIYLTFICILFYFILFYLFILFYFILFYLFILFYFILFYLFALFTFYLMVFT